MEANGLLPLKGGKKETERKRNNALSLMGNACNGTKGGTTSKSTEKHPNGIFKHFRSWEPSIAQIIDKYIKIN
jgi:hypothetical protein